MTFWEKLMIAHLMPRLSDERVGEIMRELSAQLARDSDRHAERENAEHSGAFEAEGCQSGGGESRRIAQSEPK